MSLDAHGGELVLLELGGPGSSLRVTRPAASTAPWQRAVRVEVEASPWRGGIDGILDERDLARFAAELASSASPRVATLGGGRALELTLRIDRQLGAGDAEGLLAIEATLAPSGDDPYPSVTWLLFDARPAQLAAASEQITAMLAAR